VIRGQFAYAFTTGMVASVNPCGFAMLPAYLGFFLGTESEERSTTTRVTRALLVGAALTLGFLAVFLVVGTLLRNATELITNVSGWATLVIAVVLVVVGIAVIAGWRIPIATPKMTRGGGSGTFSSMFMFGVSYAVASIGCALPLFVTLLFAGSRRNGVVSGVLMMSFYGLGMGLVITALTISLAVASGGLLRVLRSAMRFVDRAAGVVMLLAGIYLVFYGIEEIQVARGNLSQGSVTKAGGIVGDHVRNFLQRQDPVVFGIVLAALVALGALGVLATRRRSASR
jgi:cytochrome c biogenesis protein CcdA